MKYKEFYDDIEGTAVQKLNKFSLDHECNVIGYKVVRYEQMNKERTYILIEVLK